MNISHAAEEQPGTATERAVAELCWEITGIDAITRFDNFYEVGGGSLNLLEVLNELSWKFGVDLNMAGLLENPSIAGLAQHIERQLHVRAEAEFPVSPAKYPRQVPTRLSIAQERAWWLEAAGEVSARSVMVVAFQFDGALDVDCLARSLDQIARRHEILRSRIEPDAGGRYMVMLDEWPRVRVIDATVTPDADASSWLDGEVARLTGTIDLRGGPLVQMLLGRRSATDHMLVVAAHHIICDQWSLLRVLPRELTILYGAGVKQEPPLLRDMRCQYAEYSSWQRDWLATPTARQDALRWREWLGSQSATRLSDGGRWKGTAVEDSECSVKWPRHFTDQIASLASSARVERSAVFIAALAVILAGLLERERFLIGTTWSQRNPSEADTLFGCFVTSMYLEADVSGAPTFNELLTRVRTAVFEAFSQQYVLLEELARHADPASPHYSATITYQRVRAAPLALPGIAVSCVAWPRAPILRGISVDVREYDDGLECECRCSSVPIPGVHAGELLSRLESVLRTAVASSGEVPAMSRDGIEVQPGRIA